MPSRMNGESWMDRLSPVWARIRARAAAIASSTIVILDRARQRVRASLRRARPRWNAALDRARFLGARWRERLRVWTADRGRLALLGRALALSAFLLGLGVWVWSGAPDCAADGCPDGKALAEYRPPEAPHVFDAEGRLMGHLPGEIRFWMPLDSFPATLIEAIIAVEDRRFHQHRGLDLRGIARAVLVNLRAGEVREGASTITMQLARNLWEPGLREHGRWRRKAVEARLALRLEGALEKDQILELYLNRIYLGRGLYGMAVASRHYFGKAPSELSLSEIATLVGAVKAPERYNPRTRPEDARARREVVLDVLGSAGVADPGSIARARSDSLGVPDTIPLAQGRSYYAFAVQRELREIFPDPGDRQGLRVFTAFDPSAQAAAEARLSEQIRRIESGRYGRYPHPVPSDSLGRADGDSPWLQGSVLVMDVRSGAVRAVVGGRSFEHSEFDRVFLARRQAGSAFKPLVYAAALENRSVTLADVIDTRPIELARHDGLWVPADDQATGETMNARTALARSSNWAAVRVGMRVGTGPVARFVERAGIETAIDRVPAAFLGSTALHPAELVAAYAAIGNGGQAVTPHLITRVEDRTGRVVYRHDAPPRQAMDPRVAFLTRRALRDVVDRGTGGAARRGGYWGPAAGKTGTTDDWRDAWFIGFNGEVVVGVWLGFDRPRRIMTGGFGGTLAAPVWGAIMRDLYGAGGDAPDLPPRPPGLREVEVDVETGYAVSGLCLPEDPRLELFLPGTEPRAGCPLHVQPPVMAGDDTWSWDGVLRIGTAVGSVTVTRPPTPRSDPPASAADEKRSGGLRSGGSR